MVMTVLCSDYDDNGNGNIYAKGKRHLDNVHESAKCLYFMLNGVD